MVRFSISGWENASWVMDWSWMAILGWQTRFFIHRHHRNPHIDPDGLLYVLMESARMEQVQWLMDLMDVVPWSVREPARTDAAVGRCTVKRRPRSIRLLGSEIKLFGKAKHVLALYPLQVR